MAEDTCSILDYVETQFDTFGKRPLNDVDSLVLSWVAYWHLSKEETGACTSTGTPLADLYRNKRFSSITTVAGNESLCRHLLAALVASPRFGDLRIANYVDKKNTDDEMQFSAMTFLFPDDGAYVAFRGTDGSLVGWKEDFNMAFETEIPSQREAVDYLNSVAAVLERPLYVGGHSKGGNLAVYAAVNANRETTPWLREVYSHDGPGFTEETMSSEVWQKAQYLIHKTIPKNSVVGMLFERQEDYAVVASSGSGIFQHDPLTWTVEGTEFKLEEDISAGARHVDESINEWISGMTREEREEFVDTLFNMFEAGGESSFGALRENWQTSIPRMIAYVAVIDSKKRNMMLRVLRALLTSFIPEIDLSGLFG